jgi:hypothetical protein
MFLEDAILPCRCTINHLISHCHRTLRVRHFAQKEVEDEELASSFDASCSSELTQVVLWEGMYEGQERLDVHCHRLSRWWWVQSEFL